MQKLSASARKFYREEVFCSMRSPARTRKIGYSRPTNTSW